jgi:hypothetical protein
MSFPVKKLDPNPKESIVCAVAKDLNSNTFQGDNGSPIYYGDGNKQILVGLTSYGSGCIVESIKDGESLASERAFFTFETLLFRPLGNFIRYAIEIKSNIFKRIKVEKL